VGDTSDIVTTDFGYHIIRVEEKKAARKFDYDDVKDVFEGIPLPAKRREENLKRTSKTSAPKRKLK
jgi:parvulin-like peptidyl-prolyl isomerase